MSSKTDEEPMEQWATDILSKAPRLIDSLVPGTGKPSDRTNYRIERRKHGVGLREFAAMCGLSCAEMQRVEVWSTGMFDEPQIGCGFVDGIDPETGERFGYFDPAIEMPAAKKPSDETLAKVEDALARLRSDQ